MKGKNIGRVAVLAGGPSSERDISLRSGRAVYNALIQEGIDVIFMDVSEGVVEVIRSNKFDIAFIALHGRFGEDGTIQKMLEDARIPYTGSGVDASRNALDKVISKSIFKDNNISSPGYKVLDKESFLSGHFSISDFPVVVKPQFEGSSIGLSIVKHPNDLKTALDNAFKYGHKVIIENFIEGRELTVGILDDEALPVVEIVTRNNVYDYHAKYNDPETKYLVPAPIDEECALKIQKLGVIAHKALGCKSFSRVDIMLSNNKDAFVLEVNTIPGMTERSLLPKAAAAIGINFNRLCVKLIENALK